MFSNLICTKIFTPGNGGVDGEGAGAPPLHPLSLRPCTHDDNPQDVMNVMTRIEVFTSTHKD